MKRFGSNIGMLSLKTQISGVIVFSAIVLMTSIGILFMIDQFAEIKQDEKAFLDESMDNAAAMAYAIAPHLVGNDLAFMNELVSHFGNRSNHIYVCIVDTQNRIMAQSNGAALGSTLQVPSLHHTKMIGEGAVGEYTRDGKEFIDISYPIKAGDLVLGAVRIGLDNHWQEEEKDRRKKAMFLYLVLSAFIIVYGYIVSKWIVNKIVRPILRLKEAADKVGKGDYSQLVKADNRDEIGILNGSFNRMVEDLKNARTKLVEKKYVDSIIAGMSDGLIVLTPEGLIRTVNESITVLSGYSEHELLHKPISLLFGGSSAACGVLSTLKEKGSAYSHEIDLLSKDGRIIPALVSCSVVNGENTISWTVCVVKDITELKRTEQKLRLFSQAIEKAIDCVHIIDLDGRIIYSNRASEEMYGYSANELVGRHVDELNSDNEIGRKVIIPSIKKTGKWSGELIRRKKDGQKFPIWLSASIVRDEHGEPLAMLGLIRDITDRKCAEDALRTALAKAQEEKIRSEAIIAAIGDQMIILDPGFKITYENDHAVNTIGSHVGEICYQAYERREAVCEDCPVALSFHDGQIHRGERIAKSIVGTLHLDICAAPLKDASGNITAVIEIIRDISVLKQAEEKLRKSHEELEQLVKERTAELTILSIQLRNLSTYLQEAREKERTLIAREIHDELGQSLTALKMDLSLLTRRLPKGENKVLEKAESMAALIETTIQSVKRISTELRPGILDHLGLTAALDWQANEFRKRTGITCDVVCEPDEIVVDRDRTTTVFRIFQETMTNIARHANASKVDVLLKREEKELVLQVKDNGVGIAEEQLSDVGSLGLIGMRERVHYWGGTLAITGTRNKGTMVDARIPLGVSGGTE
jgi:PAS domain S-box-containing protein